MNAESVKIYFEKISKAMWENEDYLVKLDQQNGDGDLGISMNKGFAAVAEAIKAETETDLGRLFMKASKTLNENSPSSLGTILSIGLMGIAKALKGKTEVDYKQAAEAVQMGIDNIMAKTGSKPGEKTILDSLQPGADALKKDYSSLEEVLKAAAKAAAEGSELTKTMKAVHGRAAYYAEKSIGVLDGGSVVGRLIFEAIAQ